MSVEPEMKANKVRKHKYRERLIEYLNEYKNILLVRVDNVGSRQMQLVRIALRGEGVVLMGKNTVIRKVLRDESVKNPKLAQLIEYIVGNVGFVFTNGDLAKLRNTIQSNKVPAPARSGMIAPVDVFVPPGPTGLDPGQTSFFQALNIGTKISRGSIEILTQVHLVRAGDRVGSSSVALLSKLGIRPFFFGMVVETVYENGSLYDASILDLSADDLLGGFFNGIGCLAAISMEIGTPNQATVPHSIAKALKKMIALSLVTEYTFEESAIFKDPEALAAAMAAANGGDAAAGGDAGGDGAAAAAVVEEEEEEEEPAADMFGGDEEADY
jgi:large subunit ribosomal protein LP0